MTTQGQQIAAADYNAVVPTSSAVAGTSSSQLSVVQLWGVGYGTRGYGQASVLLAPVQSGSVVGRQWSNLLTALRTMAVHSGVSLSGTASTLNFDVGAPIVANSFDWDSAVLSLDSARMDVDPAQTAVVVPFLPDKRETNWDTEIFLQFRADFVTEDLARYFFNSGSTLRIFPSVTGTLPTPNPDAMLVKWQQFLDTVGIVTIGANNTSQSLSGGTSENKGFYQLSDTMSKLFEQTTVDNNSKFIVEAKRENYVGVNGGNGSRILIKVRFLETTTNSVATTQANPLSVEVSLRKAQTPLPAPPGTVPFQITNPSVYIVDQLSVGGSNFYNFTDIINDTRYNYNLMTEVLKRTDYTAGQLIIANIVVSSTGKIGSQPIVSSSSITRGPALTIPAVAPNPPASDTTKIPAGSIVQIVNNGLIAGQGGKGGTANSWWGTPSSLAGDYGTAAIKLNYPAQINNLGIIGGGGGGGGGSGTRGSGQTYDDPGACGGGGAGLDPGAGGVFDASASAFLGFPVSYAGQAGNQLTGGAGGTVSPHGSSSEWFFGYPGGAGGDLGQPGQSGQSDYNGGGGFGGQAGLGIDGMQNVKPGSSLGDLRGQTDFRIQAVGNPNAGHDFAGFTGINTSLTSTVQLILSTPFTDPGMQYSWSQTPPSANGISITTVTPTDALSYTVSFASSSNAPAPLVSTFVFQVTTNTGISTQPLSVTVVHNYVDSGAPVAPTPFVPDYTGGANGAG